MGRKSGEKEASIVIERVTPILPTSENEGVFSFFLVLYFIVLLVFIFFRLIPILGLFVFLLIFIFFLFMFLFHIFIVLLIPIIYFFINLLDDSLLHISCSIGFVVTVHFRI
jgi:hypothetical protein